MTIPGIKKASDELLSNVKPKLRVLQSVRKCQT